MHVHRFLSSALLLNLLALVPLPAAATPDLVRNAVTQTQAVYTNHPAGQRYAPLVSVFDTHLDTLRLAQQIAPNATTQEHLLIASALPYYAARKYGPVLSVLTASTLYPTTSTQHTNGTRTQSVGVFAGMPPLRITWTFSPQGKVQTLTVGNRTVVDYDLAILRQDLQRFDTIDAFALYLLNGAF